MCKFLISPTFANSWNEIKLKITIPNIVTFIRLMMFPIVWYYCFHGEQIKVAILVIICLLSDFLDGYLARTLNCSTSFGAKFDSFADNLMLGSFVFWIWLILPEIWSLYQIYLGVLLLQIIVVFLIMIFKYKRMVEIHTILSKVGVSIMWLFFIYTLLFGFNTHFFYVFIVTSYTYLIEDIYLLLTRDGLDENEKGLLF